jgi:hypothetical protein
MPRIGRRIPVEKREIVASSISRLRVRPDAAMPVEPSLNGSLQPTGSAPTHRVFLMTVLTAKVRAAPALRICQKAQSSTTLSSRLLIGQSNSRGEGHAPSNTA